MCGLTACVVLQQQLHGNLTDGNPTNGYSKVNGNVEVNGHTKNKASSLETEINDSLEIIKHRGPDARGVWISPDRRVGMDLNTGFC
jgi:asparagine synthase (glutamine-hydrolysing)